MNLFQMLISQDTGALHPSAAEWLLAALIAWLSLGSHTMRLLRLAGDEYLKFRDCTEILAALSPGLRRSSRSSSSGSSSSASTAIAFT